MLPNPNALGHRFTLSYPRYGTIDPIPRDADGNPVSATPTNPTAFRLYSLGITIIWVFQDGFDYPRIQTTVGFGDVPGPDRVNFDVRGPYGVMIFDNGVDRVIERVIWGDRFHFRSFNNPLTRNRSWAWNASNPGARYHALIAGGFEMGLIEPRQFGVSALPTGSPSGAASRRTLSLHPSGQFAGRFPCNWEWPYQSAQYSLP